MLCVHTTETTAAATQKRARLSRGCASVGSPCKKGRPRRNRFGPGACGGRDGGWRHPPHRHRLNAYISEQHLRFGPPPSPVADTCRSVPVAFTVDPCNGLFFVINQTVCVHACVRACARIQLSVCVVFSVLYVSCWFHASPCTVLNAYPYVCVVFVGVVSAALCANVLCAYCLYFRYCLHCVRRVCLCVSVMRSRVRVWVSVCTCP